MIVQFYYYVQKNRPCTFVHSWETSRKAIRQILALIYARPTIFLFQPKPIALECIRVPFFEVINCSKTIVKTDPPAPPLSTVSIFL